MNNGIKRNEFYYELPEELIAQNPAEKRDMSRLMVVHRRSGKIEHMKFFEIVKYLKENDCLVLNNTRVIPARIFGEKTTGANIEVLLTKRLNTTRWECLMKPGKRAKPGAEVVFSEELRCTVLSDGPEGIKTIEFKYEGCFEEILERTGRLPLPPYIKKSVSDEKRYQTVYAQIDGSSAAPTAGLHFTEELLEELKKKGINTAYVTLHVGLGTFRPVKSEYVEEHDMHSEWYELDEDNYSIIKESKQNGGRIISVGTTSTRTLESIAGRHGKLQPDKGWTDIFIYPGYKFKAVDCLITNFHLPESTLIMLVSAFAGHELTMNAYKKAIEKEYRFFSFGDAMMILQEEE